MSRIKKEDVYRGRWEEATRITDALIVRRKRLRAEIATATRQGIDCTIQERRLDQTIVELADAKETESAALAALRVEERRVPCRRS